MTNLAWKIPDNISYEQAATVSTGVYSAAMCMTHPKRLAMTEWPGKISNEQWVSSGILCSSLTIFQLSRLFILLYCSMNLLTCGTLVHSFVSFFLQFLVYSGSTAVGHYAVQLAHLSGYKVVATASPKNHGTLESLGADVVFDVRTSRNPFYLRSRRIIQLTIRIHTVQGPRLTRESQSCHWGHPQDRPRLFRLP